MADERRDATENDYDGELISLDDDRDGELIERRAQLLPEESSVGSDDPEAQAEAILADSEERTEVPEAAPTSFVEHRTSEQTL